MSRIFTNGDSITYGYWDEEVGGWANRVKLNIMQARDFRHELVNLALGNQTLNKMVDRFPDQIKPYGRARSLGVFMLGASDLVIRRGASRPQNSIGDFRQQLRQLGSTLVEGRVTPLFVGLYPVDETRSNPSPITGDSFSVERGLEYDGAVREYAATIDAPYVSLEPFWGSFTNGTALSSDGVHPSTEGHEIIANVVTEAIYRRLARPLLTYT